MAQATTEAFARLFEAVHEGVYIGTVDGPATFTISANPYLKLMFGFAADTPQAEVRPFEAERFIDRQARDGFVERLQRDGAVTDYLMRLRRADRVAIWVEVTAHAEIEDGGALRVEALMRDVSERKRLEDQARDLYHQLLQAEKLAALGQTISGVAHELNNPLATILTWAERLSQRDVDAQTKRGLETILSESERAAKIVRNLLVFAGSRRMSRRRVSVDRVIARALASRAASRQRNGIEAVVERPSEPLPPVLGDALLLQQAVLNILINAEHAVVDNASRPRRISIATTLAGDRVSIAIRDSGAGIPADALARIFDPFFTTKEVGKGTGLGLAITYGIVQELGGTITAHNAPDGGAVFSIELPAAPSVVK